MFAKNYRVVNKEDFDKISRNGKVFYCDFFMVKVLRNDLGFNRFAVVVSKKVSLKAVVRNGVKRKIREALRRNVGVLPEGCDVVVCVNRSVLGKGFEEIEEKLRECFKK